jgi:hypothetical protein
MIVGGWLKLPENGKPAGNASSDRTEVYTSPGEPQRHGHASTTGTFTDKNCPLCKGVK